MASSHVRPNNSNEIHDIDVVTAQTLTTPSFFDPPSVHRRRNFKELFPPFLPRKVRYWVHLCVFGFYCPCYKSHICMIVGCVWDDSYIFTCVRDLRGWCVKQEQPERGVAIRAIGRRWLDRHCDDLCGWPYFRGAHEPRSHVSLRRGPAFPMDTGESFLAHYIRNLDKNKSLFRSKDSLYIPYLQIIYALQNENFSW